jgi:hypothetical protein
MMHAGKIRNIIAMFLASAAVSAQSDTSPVKSANRAGPPEARQIMEASIAATERSWHARLHYSYIERDEDRRRDSAGHVKSEEIDDRKRFWSMAFRSSNSWKATDGLFRSNRSGNRKTNSTS